MIRQKLLLLIFVLVSLISKCNASEYLQNTLHITDVGAVGDSSMLNTQFIQSAIDQMHTQGGGTVVVPRGEFVSGALFFKPGVNLHLQEGAVLRCSREMENFPPQHTRIEGHFEENFTPALINADGCDGFKLTGKGTLDGAGRPIWNLFWKKRKAAKDHKNFNNLSIPRARLCLIENSQDVLIEGITFKDSQFWNLHIYNCQDVQVKRANFRVPDDYRQVPSSDGIDIDSSQSITIQDCSFSVTDDCIALKGTKGPFALEDETSPPVEKIRVSGCEFHRGHGMITCGSEATIVRDVVVENCHVTGAMPVVRLKLRPDTPQCYEDFTFRNITVDNRRAHLFDIQKWTQYFDLMGEPEPNSVVQNIKVLDLRGSIGSLGTITGNANTEFGEITVEDVNVSAKNSKIELDNRVKNISSRNILIDGKAIQL